MVGLCGNVCLVAEKNVGREETFAWEKMGRPHLLGLRVSTSIFFLLRVFPAAKQWRVY